MGFYRERMKCQYLRPTYPRAGDDNLASDWGEWGAVVGTSGGDDSSSKDDASKGEGAVVVEPRSKIPQQPGKPAKKTKIPLGNLQ